MTAALGPIILFNSNLTKQYFSHEFMSKLYLCIILKKSIALISKDSFSFPGCSGLILLHPSTGNIGIGHKFSVTIINKDHNLTGSV
jgi:hypothetical protein